MTESHGNGYGFIRIQEMAKHEAFALGVMSIMMYTKECIAEAHAIIMLPRQNRRRV